MVKYIAILRGINVGGRRKILMADLRQLFSDLGFLDVSTYIQSGNVFFHTQEAKNNIELADSITKAIAEKYGFDVPVIIRNLEEIEEIISTHPFATETEEDVARLAVTFLKTIPKTAHLSKIETYDYSPDRFKIIGNNVMLFCAGKYHETKLSNKFFETKLKPPATTRNWKTVLKLAELARK